MKVYFADTSYDIALLVPQDSAHARATHFLNDRTVGAVTTTEVLLELSAYFAKPPLRSGVIRLIDRLQKTPQFTLLPSSPQRFEAAWQSYRHHTDKSWSLTDCISFNVMKERELTEALTTDHHFEQAGYRALLRRSKP